MLTGRSDESWLFDLEHREKDPESRSGNWKTVLITSYCTITVYAVLLYSRTSYMRQRPIDIIF